MLYTSARVIETLYLRLAVLQDQLTLDLPPNPEPSSGDVLGLFSREMFDLMLSFEHRDLEDFCDTPQAELAFRLEHQINNICLAYNTLWHDQVQLSDFLPVRGCEWRTINGVRVCVFDKTLYERTIEVVERLDWRESLRLLTALESYEMIWDETCLISAGNADKLYVEMQSYNVSAV